MLEGCLNPFPQIEEQMTPTEKAAVEKVHKQLDRLTMARQQVNCKMNPASSHVQLLFDDTLCNVAF